MSAESEIRTKHLQALDKEIRSMRGWLDYLEKDVTTVADDRGVISAVLITSVSESAMKITYNAGIVNGTLLKD
jgi:hypothetical protein